MYNYILKRILLMIPTLFGAAFLVFFLLRLIPGDVCELRLAGTGLYVDQETIDICREKLGLHEPMIVQFFSMRVLDYFQFLVQIWIRSHYRSLLFL